MFMIQTLPLVSPGDYFVIKAQYMTQFVLQCLKTVHMANRCLWGSHLDDCLLRPHAAQHQSNHCWMQTGISLKTEILKRCEPVMLCTHLSTVSWSWKQHPASSAQMWGAPNLMETASKGWRKPDPWAYPSAGGSCPGQKSLLMSQCHRGHLDLWDSWGAFGFK